MVEVDRGRLDLGVNCTFEAPGHGSVVEDIAGTPWLLYHAWPYQRKEVVSHSLYHVSCIMYHVLDSSFKVTPPGRVLLLDRLVFEDGWPRVQG